MVNIKELIEQLANPKTKEMKELVKLLKEEYELEINPTYMESEPSR